MEIVDICFWFEVAKDPILFKEHSDSKSKHTEDNIINIQVNNIFVVFGKVCFK